MNLFKLQRLIMTALLLASTGFSSVWANVHYAHYAAVAMPDKYSAQVAKQILQQGGNAVDAAVASAFVLAVTYPEAGNLGGGGFMTLYTPKIVVPNSPTDKDAENNALNVHFLDYREQAPLAASQDMYLDDNNQVIPYKSLVGYQASGVPGTVMGLWQVHQRFASLAWQTLLQPAIELAQNGFEVSSQLADRSQWFKRWIADKSSTPLNFESYFGGLKVGQVLKQPELAKTLKRIAKQGAEDFYLGETAKMMVKQLQKHDGLITLQDLAGYQAKWRKPVVGEWLGYQVVSAPPPSSGGIAIVQLLKMKQQLVDKLDKALLQARKSGLSETTIKTHFYAELEKRVYADRAHFLGDPDFIDVPVDKLISDEYLRERGQGVLLDEISESELIKPGKIELPETTHFSIVDAQGNAVSNTYTLNMPFGSGVVIEGAGFLMNDEMDDFSTKPGVANVFGVVGGQANAIAPRKRMLSSMSPTILLKDGQVQMVVGTPGGSTIITSVFQTIVNVVEERMSAQQAVDAPRVHHQLLPKDLIAYNPDLPDQVKQELELMGYSLKKNNYMGDVQLLVNTDKAWQAASDNRGEGVAWVFEVDTPTSRP
ncbi:gamma-glutamyltranspeptidase [Thiomicrorhabdus immobilis]|uniref:Glutathione hydrolase proenzyme n=1 Tax=Thiomicrorhabdus immobilis TaxID=2791037 RepID=A0ABM7MEQ4_9GAMM|nr:gamma-glutamyltransferase [Thiomicrorhabdus immobilis]BCN93900.1 gamma-glutamyltranspeptidase [Thiomicrorhabdus immobilis]